MFAESKRFSDENFKRTIYTRLTNAKNSEKFFKTFHDKIDVAQKEIKNMNSFMSSDVNDGW